jgi:hypothetical protein
MEASVKLWGVRECFLCLTADPALIRLSFGFDGAISPLVLMH